MRIIDYSKHSKKIGYLILIFIYFLIFIPITIPIPKNNRIYTQDQEIRSSSIWATLDLINPGGINGSRFTHNTVISIQGRLYSRIPPYPGEDGYTVAIEVDDVIYSSYNDVTHAGGYFQIDYTIDPLLDIYSSHKIEAIVIDPTPDTVEYRTHYIIYVNTTSYFDIIGPPTPQLLGDLFDPNAYLRSGDDNGITFASVNYRWYNGPVVVASNFVSTNGGGLIQNIPIPDIGVEDLDLLLNFTSVPYIGYSEVLITDSRIFSNISCIWNLPSTIRASSNLTIAGKLVSRNNPSLALNNKVIQIHYNGTSLGEIQTDNNGDFSINHTLSATTGPASITLLMPNTLAKTIITTFYFNVQQASVPVGPGIEIPPFMLFSSIFFPILGVVLGLLAFYGYRYYKNQEKASKRVILPLEDKIKNLKILKDSGRLEESLSYLFNAIYMELINAKYGRKRKENETIRDFAIVSVKDLKLSPSSIYPFIQKVEEIIYAKPFQINEKDFYHTIDLFSPVYFEMTGYNFILNF